MQVRSAFVGVFVVLAGAALSFGQSTQPAGQADPPAGDAAADQASPEPKRWLVGSKAASVKRDTEPPSYVRSWADRGLSDAEDLEWLEFGLEHRTRFERRDEQYRRNLESDDFILMRSRGYLGVKEVLDPLRFGFEFQDSRQFGSALPTSRSDVNENDILQAFGEFHIDDVLGPGEPIALRFGRMASDQVDRRLISRNRYRNTTNAFDGLRLRFGRPTSRAQLDVLAMQPVERRLNRRDRTDEERWLYGVIGYWRGWPEYVTLEPYYLILDGDFKDRDRGDQTLHTLGLHAYGPIAGTRFDYDVDAAFQFGDNGRLQHRAFATHAELGYSFDLPWKPRLAGWVNYATGDRDPTDGSSGRFNSLFGSSNTFYGYGSLFSWQNLINPTVRLQLHPTEKLSYQAFWRLYYLASRKDAFIRAGLSDPTGRAGRYLGQQVDMKFVYKLSKLISFEVGYAHFFPGHFVGKTGRAKDSDYFFAETRLSF